MYEKKTYKFVGNVMNFDNVMSYNYEDITMAESKKKAISNIKYKYKKKYNLSPIFKIDLVGDIMEESGNGL